MNTLSGNQITQPIHVSASQLKTYQSCPRKHWLQKVAQVPSQKLKMGAERGKRLHSLVEQYLTTAPAYTGETFPAFLETHKLWDHELRHGLRSASKGDHLTELREASFDPETPLRLLVEQEFKLSHLFLGFMDVVVLDSRQGSLSVGIRDHKFMSDKRSIMDEDLAKSDFQTLIYAKALLTFFAVDSVTWSYDYYGTKYCWHEKVNFTLTRSDLECRWLPVLIETSRVLDNYSIPCGSQTTPSYLSCGKYGGCEYKPICFGGTK